MKSWRAVLIVVAVIVTISALEARAYEYIAIDQVEHDYTIKRGESPWLGFVDGVNLLIPAEPTGKYSHLYLGPLGRCSVPFSATQGLIGCCVVAGILTVLPALVVSRSARKRVDGGRAIQ
jgi:hypothetical protein